VGGATTSVEGKRKVSKNGQWGKEGPRRGKERENILHTRKRDIPKGWPGRRGGVKKNSRNIPFQRELKKKGGLNPSTSGGS